jgi:hypothetical protein
MTSRLSLLTNDEVLAVNQTSSGNQTVVHRGILIAWVADVANSKDKYVALFNTRDVGSNSVAARVAVEVTGGPRIHRRAVSSGDLWAQNDLGQVAAELSVELPPHGAALYRVSANARESRAAALAAAARAADLDKAYLFTYFIGNGEDGLHLAWSKDGYKWDALKGGKSFLTPVVGESKLMRDPCVVRGPDGTFHMVWTTAWWGKTIGYASSKDLINWSEQQAVPVMAHEPAAKNCWAPEIVWDARREEFLIFWATTITNHFSRPRSAGTTTIACMPPRRRISKPSRPRSCFTIRAST